VSGAAEPVAGGPRTPLLGGGAVSLLSPRPDMICLEAIALGLSRQRRWLGQTRRPLSVLEHSCAVALACPRRLMLPGLLHDAHEAFTGDITRGMRGALSARLPVTFQLALDRITAEIDGAVAHAVVGQCSATPLPGPSGRARGQAFWERERGASLAAAMMDPELMRLDAAMSEHEHAVLVEAKERFGWDRLGHYADVEPGAGRLVSGWLKAVRLLAEDWPSAEPLRCEVAVGVLRGAMELG
jgi:hypothetical protein